MLESVGRERDGTADAESRGHETEPEHDVEDTLGAWLHLDVPQEKGRYQGRDDVNDTGERLSHISKSCAQQHRGSRFTAVDLGRDAEDALGVALGGAVNPVGTKGLAADAVADRPQEGNDQVDRHRDEDDAGLYSFKRRQETENEEHDGATKKEP